MPECIKKKEKKENKAQALKKQITRVGYVLQRKGNGIDETSPVSQLFLHKLNISEHCLVLKDCVLMIVLL